MFEDSVKDLEEQLAESAGMIEQLEKTNKDLQLGTFVVCHIKRFLRNLS